MRLGEVANRIGVPANNTYVPGGSTGIMSRTWHKLYANVTSLQIAIPNWYVLAGEHPTGAAMTIRLSVESAGGALTQGTVAGNPAPVIADGGTAIFTVPFTGNAGDKFYIRVLRTGTRIPYSGPSGTRALDLSGGDAFEFTTTDKTMSGTVVDSGSTTASFPISCKALTPNGWFVVACGDSRGTGSSDALAGPEATGNCGEIERPLGGTYAYSNLSSPGESAAAYLAACSRRIALIDPGAIVVCQMGVNDVASSGGGVSAATLATRTAAVYAAVLAQVGSTDFQFWTTTIPPVVHTSDNLTTLVGQTPDANSAQIQLANAHRLANPEGYTGCLDVASFVADPTDPTRWKVNAGVPFQYAYDDRPSSSIVIHETRFANQQLAFSFAPAPPAVSGKLLTIERVLDWESDPNIYLYSLKNSP